MPILDITTTAVQTVTAAETPTDHVYRNTSETATSTIFNKDQDITTIEQYVSGQKWSVDYFVQVRDLNEAPLLPDINVPATRLKYNRINKLILHLQTALDQTDPNNVTGDAIINAGLVPNYGDVILATITGGREALFVVTLVEKKTYNLHEAYSITFKLYMFLDKEGVEYRDIVYKTLKEYYYDKDHLLDYSAPVILAQDYKKKLDLKSMPNRVVEHYFKYMINPEKNVIAVPTLSSIFVDTLLNSFIYKIVNRDAVISMFKITEFEIDLSETIKTTVWDAILYQDVNMLQECKRDIGFLYTPLVSANVTLRQAGYLGINYIANDLAGVTPEVPGLQDIKTATTVTIEQPILIRDDNYIFSAAFYNQDIANCGILEQALLQYLRGEIVDASQLDIMLSQYTHWDTIDQYYLLPILLVLIQESIQYTYTSL